MPPFAMPAAGNVHLWHLELDALASQRDQDLWNVLSIDERERASRFALAYLRERYTACRAGLRILIGGYVDVPPQDLVFAYGKHGKPHLPDKDLSYDLRFNVSHCEGTALIALATATEVGVDVEGGDRILDWDAMAQVSFATAECHAPVGEEDKRAWFFRLWTLREAFMKGVGLGLSLDQEAFSIQSLENGRCRVHSREDQYRQWHLRSLNVGHPWFAAVALEGPLQECRMFSFSAVGAVMRERSDSEVICLRTTSSTI